MPKDRHARVPVICEVCGKEFQARTERVEKGLGRFCSKGCFDFYQRENRKKFWGRKDLATKYKTGGRYSVKWYDENGKTKTTSYPRWWWEMNVGEIPSGGVILYKDGNPLNIDPNNFELGTKSDALVRGNRTRKSDTVSWSNYQNAQSKRMIKKWEDGDFDSLKGSGHYRWRGGSSKRDIYPNSFYEIREFIKSRDNYICQICGKDVSGRGGHVHHINGNKKDSSPDNLILFCQPCHTKVHFGVGKSSPVIMAFRSKLVV